MATRAVFYFISYRRNPSDVYRMTIVVGKSIRLTKAWVFQQLEDPNCSYLLIQNLSQGEVFTDLNGYPVMILHGIMG